MTPLKKLNATILTICAVVTIGLCGCALFGQDPRGPSAMELRVFNAETNYVPRLAFETNTVLQTNFIPVFVTNEIGRIVERTNEIVIPKYELIQVTNEVPVITLTPKLEAVEDVKTIGGIADIAVPGSGGLVTGIGIGLLSLWGRLRSGKRNGIVLAQNIEAILEFVKTVPDGQKAADAIKSYLKDNQREVGAFESVVTILNKYVNKPEAKTAAAEIKAALEALKQNS